MFSRKTAFAVIVGSLVFLSPVLAQRTPSSHLATYQGDHLEVSYPDTWTINVTGSAVTLAPEDGIVSGSLAYGMLMDIFEPSRRNALEQNSFTLSEATERLITDLQRTNPNLRVIRKTEKRIAGEPALEVEMSNESPVGGHEVDRLTTVLRSRDTLYYFLAVAPESELKRYSVTFNRMLSSIRFYN